MASFSDRMDARHEADSVQASLQHYGSQIEDGARDNLALAVCLAADAICARLASLEMTLAYVGDKHGR